MKADTESDKAIELIKKYTRHSHARLVHRGNAAIFTALYIIKRVNAKPFILIPDQGGWISFQTYPKMLGFEIRTVKTNRGVIDLIDLEKKAEAGAALLLTSFAGYFAEQPMKYIAQICHDKKCLVIEDASGALGDEVLANGEYADIIVGSFGKWKPINAEYGGFISTSNQENFDEAKEAFSMTNHYPEYSVLIKKLENAQKRIATMLKEAEKVKADLAEKLPHIKLVHGDLRGLNVIAKYTSEEEKEEILKYCKTNDLEYVQCPSYIRLDEDAISIELKRRGDAKS